MVDKRKITLPLILIDGDIIFTGDPAVVMSNAMRKTFLLQRNPCFSVISDYRRSEQYKAELLQYNTDIEAYNNDAKKYRYSTERQGILNPFPL